MEVVRYKKQGQWGHAGFAAACWHLLWDFLGAFPFRTDNPHFVAPGVAYFAKKQILCEIKESLSLHFSRSRCTLKPF